MYMTSLAARVYQDTLLQEAEKDHRRDSAGATRPRLQERLVVRVGALLVSAGLWLQAQHEPMIYSPKARRTGC